MAKIIIGLIRLYQVFFSNLIRHNALPLVFSSSCRFYPTCSDYAIESVKQYGVRKGSIKALSRVLKCNPLSSCLNAAKRVQ